MIRKKWTATKQKPKGGGGPNLPRPWGRIEPDIGEELGGRPCDFSTCLQQGQRLRRGGRQRRRRAALQPIEPWRTAHRWSSLSAKGLSAAFRCWSAPPTISCATMQRRVPGRCLPSPRPPGRRPLCPHLRLRGAGQSAANHGMFPGAPNGMLGDRGRRETQLRERAGPSRGHGAASDLLTPTAPDTGNRDAGLTL